MLSQSAAMLCASLGQIRTDSPLLEGLAMRLGVVSSVGIDALEPTTGTTDATSYRLDSINQREALSHVVTIRSGEDGVQRDSLSLHEERAFKPRTSSIGRIRPRRPPFPTARTEDESADARFPSSWSAALSLSSKTCWSLSRMPAFRRSRRRRQHVIPEPHPISNGRSSQGMPVRHLRFSTGLRSECFLRRGLGGGNSGSIMDQSPSSIMGRAIAIPPPSSLQGESCRE
jgi:hypothetical protein